MATLEKATADIVREFKQGLNSEENFRCLFYRYGGQLYRFFQRKALPAEDCQDLTQEVLFCVYKRLGGLQEEDKFENWLFKMAKNTYLSKVRAAAAGKRNARPVSLEERLERSQDISVTATADPEA